MPSSLTRVRSCALVSSTCLPVSVCGTGSAALPRPPFVPGQVLTPCGVPAGTRSYSLLSRRRRPTSLNGPRLAAPHPPQDRTRSSDGHWCRNLNRLSITYALQPRLRPDSPTAECPCSGILRHTAVEVLAPHYVTHPDIRTRQRSTSACADASPPWRRSPTIRTHRRGSHASVRRLAPLNCRRGGPRPVSSYALFQGWLLLSQPPGCLGTATSFTTQRPLGDLSGGSGLLPS